MNSKCNKKIFNLSSLLSKPIIISTLIGFFTLLGSMINIVRAQEISLKEAIEWGRNNSFSLKQKRGEITTIERELKALEGSLSWQLSLDSNTAYNSFESGELRGEGGLLELNLNGSKSFISGLNILANYTLMETEPFNFNNLNEKYDFSLDLSKRLYPLVPTETEKKFIKTRNNLINAKEELQQEISKKELDWLESYLNLSILQQRVKNAEIGYSLALENLNKIHKQETIGEAGREQIIIAEIGLKEAALNLEQVTENLRQASKKFQLELGLSVDKNPIIKQSDKYLDNITTKAKGIEVDLENEEKLLGFLKENNPVLRTLERELDYIQKSLEWELKKDNPGITAIGNYTHNYKGPEDNWSVGINFSYDFLDGGQHEIALNNIQATIELLEEQYQNTLEELRLQLQSLTANYQLASQKLQIMALISEKLGLESELYKEQYSQGLISEYQLREKNLEARQTEIDFKEASNAVLFTRLKILNFLGLF